jgi:hypothetical protein
MTTEFDPRRNIPPPERAESTPEVKGAYANLEAVKGGARPVGGVLVFTEEQVAKAKQEMDADFAERSRKSQSQPTK